ncbi:hypothetical protein [Xanthomonas axonopodis]
MNFAEKQRIRNEFYQSNPGPQPGMTDQVHLYRQQETTLKNDAKAAFNEEIKALSASNDKDQLKRTVSRVDSQSKQSAFQSDQIDNIMDMLAQQSNRQSNAQSLKQGAYQTQHFTRDSIDEMNAHEEKFNAFMREKGRVPVEGEMEKFTAKPTVTQSEKAWEQKPKSQSM